MLEAQIQGIKIFAMTSSLPTTKKVSQQQARAYFHCPENQSTSDLGHHAAQRLLQHVLIDKEDFGLLLFGSKTPDYRSPITASVLQGRLGFPIDCIAYDINVGSNGFIQMIQIGAAVLKNQNKTYGLLILGDTPSKLRNQEIHQEFEISDAATAIVLQKTNENISVQFKNISLGDSYQELILREGGFRTFSSTQAFDASLFKNFVVKQNREAIQKSFETYKKSLFFSQDSSSQILFHHTITQWLQIEDENEEYRTVLADASELPITLANLCFNNKTSIENIACWSAGEGLALYGLQIQYLPICLPTEHTEEIFEDFQVNHEM